MTAVVLTEGTIRAVRPLTSRKSGEVFAHEVSILTSIGDVLGETLKVVVFEREFEVEGPRFEVGLLVSWVVEVDSGRFGLQATYKREHRAADTFDVSQAYLPTEAGV